MTTIPEAMQLALAALMAGRWQETQQICEQVLAAVAGYPPALHLLGQAAMQQGNNETAVEQIRAAIDGDATNAAFHANLGEAWRGLQRWDEALASYDRALALAPDWPEVHNNRGTLLLAQGDAAGAQASFERALAQKPNYFDALSNLGIAWQDQARANEAIASFHRALAVQPHSAPTTFRLGQLLREQGRLDEAVAVLQNAVLVNPQWVEAHSELGVLYQALGQLPESAAAYRQALAARQSGAPSATDFSKVHYNLAGVLKQLGELDEAVVQLEEAVRQDPMYALAYNNLGNGYLAQGRGEEAAACHRKAVELDPASAWVHSNLLYTLNFLPGLDPAAVFAEHLAWARRHAEPLTARAPRWTDEPLDRAPHRRLRIGYVSANFYQHAVNFFIEPVLKAHDRTQFETFAYSDVREPDDATARIEASVDHWQSTHHWTDEALAERVRADGIDILVDLSGHIGGNRLLAFARKPAPLQVTYLGYQNTTGMSAMDYRLTDERADPPGVADDFHTERLVRLPRSFFCYQPPTVAPPVEPLPAKRHGYVTFGSFNNYAKVTPEVVSTWLEILSRVEGSRLLVLARRGMVERRLRAQAGERGIDPKRIEIVEQRPLADYLRLQAEADIALDPFPFNGHTTTCDSIWMGVPVVMLAGQTYASRFGGSVMANVGLEHLIAGDREGYIDAAVELAADLDRLARTRSDLRSRMASSALLDFSGFTQNLERAYRKMWLDFLARSGLG